MLQNTERRIRLELEGLEELELEGLEGVAKYGEKD